MSQYNKSKDRGDDGRITRFITRNEGLRAWNRNGPTWFRRMTTTVPQRRDTDRVIRRIMKGEIHGDEALFLPNNRPIEWWW